ncbi:MAG: hypothetical protein IH991_18280 [Planctomycetes bacterium]|nr:hypothetical protein [Planctomycetota bacterium]
MSGQFDPYHKWLAIPPEEQPPNHYRLLAVTVFESDPDVIDTAADTRMSQLRTYQTGKNAELSQKLLNEISSARVCLLNPNQRAAYDEQLRASLVESELTPLEGTAAPLSAEIQLTNAFETPRIDTPPTDAVGPSVVQQRKPSKRPRRWMLPALLSGGSLIVLIVIIAIVSSNGDPHQQTAQGDTSSKDTPPPPSDVASKDKQDPDPNPDAAPTSRDETKLPSDVPDMPPTDDSGKPTDPPDSIEPMIDTQPKDSQPKDGKPPEEPLVETLAPKPKLPVPSDDEQRPAVERLGKVYKLSDAQSQDEQLALAKEMFDLGRRTGNDPVEMFVVLKQAMGLASDGGDARLMLEVVEAIDERFQIDVLEVKRAVLLQFAKGATSEAAIQSLFENSADFIAQAVNADRVDLAHAVSTATHAACLRPRGTKLRKQAYEQRKAIDKLHANWKKIQDALVTLQTNADDAEANLLAGRWYCFTKNNWQKGLPLLAKSSDPKLKALCAQ